MQEPHGRSSSKGSTPCIALLLLLAETIFSCQHPLTLLRPRVRFIDAPSTARTRYSLWAEACRSGPTAKPIPTALRPVILRSLSSTAQAAFTFRTTMAFPGRIPWIACLFPAGFTSVDPATHSSFAQHDKLCGLTRRVRVYADETFCFRGRRP